MTDKLFQPLKLGGGLHTLSHRVVLAPLTRVRAAFGDVPSDISVEYYEQRATEGGLLIGEASQISAEAQGLPSPGCYTVAQMEGWKRVTDAVHRRKGLFFLQLWHMGRAASSKFTPGGSPIVAPSALPMPEGYGFSPGEAEMPRALTTEEVKDRVEVFAQAAKNAILYGSDGVEVHGANGYLIDQFLSDSSNQRDDIYGGSIENRCRFALEVVDACIKSTGSSGRVGIRFSPYGAFQTTGDSNADALFKYLLKELNSRNLAYVHLIEPRGFHGQALQEQPRDVTKMFREAYKGVLLTASGYNRDEGIKVTNEGVADAVVYGRHFIANPDLPFRYKHNLEINKYNRDTFYTPGPVGYIDYPFHPSNPRAYDVRWSADLSKM